MVVECENGFSGKVLLSQYQAVIIIVMDVTIMIITFTANMMVIVGLIGAKQLDSRINRMFLALSMVDICVAVIAQPLVAVLFIVKRDQRLCNAEIVTQSLSLFFSHCSAFFIVAIGLERLLSIKSSRVPQNANQISYKRPYALMIICILASITLTTCMTLSSLKGYYYVAHIILLIVDLFALVIVYSAYIEMYRSVINHVRETAVLRQNQPSNSTAYATEMAKAIMIIIFFLFLSYIPYLTTGIIISHRTLMSGKIADGKHAFLSFIASNLVFLNSFFNPVIVLYKNKRLFDYIKERVSWTSQSFSPNQKSIKFDSCLHAVSAADVNPRV